MKVCHLLIKLKPLTPKMGLFSIFGACPLTCSTMLIHNLILVLLMTISNLEFAEAWKSLFILTSGRSLDWGKIVLTNLRKTILGLKSENFFPSWRLKCSLYNYSYLREEKGVMEQPTLLSQRILTNCNPPFWV